MNATKSVCPLQCGAETITHGDYNGYPLLECPLCRLVFTEQRVFSSELYEDVYKQPGVYRQMLETAEKTHRGEMGYRQLWWYKRMVLNWMRRLDVPRTLLDVGCGPGTFLMVARDQGWKVSGVELSREAGTKAQEFGLDVHVQTVQDYVAAGHHETFGVVTSFEVLEHVSDPLDMLQAMKTALVPGGRLIISVPNLDDPYCLKQMIPSATPPVHINFFSRASVKRMLEVTGLELVRFYSLPIPTSSVRNVEGKPKARRLMPWLLGRRLLGQADGTTLIAMARRPATR